MTDEAPAQAQGDPLPLSKRLKLLLDQRAAREGRKPASTYKLAAALEEQERRAGRWEPTPKKQEFVSPQYLGMLLRGEQDDPRRSILVALAEYFGCTLDDLAAPTRDQADLLERLRRVGLEDIGMRAAKPLAALGPEDRETLRRMLDAVERDEQ
ncbi:helix-turn-helix domain-containing protein [Streptomyces sp. NPDC003011]